MPPFAFFDEVHKSFETKEVLRGLTLVIRKGEVLVVLGGSGTGKTVILKHIVGLVPPDRGRIFIDGQEITHFDDNQLQPIRKKVGFLFQGGALFDSMSVFDNVAFPLREKGANTRISPRKSSRKRSRKNSGSWVSKTSNG